MDPEPPFRMGLPNDYEMCGACLGRGRVVSGDAVVLCSRCSGLGNLRIEGHTIGPDRGRTAWLEDEIGYARTSAGEALDWLLGFMDEDLAGPAPNPLHRSLRPALAGFDPEGVEALATAEYLVLSMSDQAIWQGLQDLAHACRRIADARAELDAMG